ncbi:filament integrity protein fraC [Oculatella sp. LEGE 06141]|uniref:filament integrity protein FraC n=1 Tax=Oculatella sp. LEGE 06141 TaxID=1828648 RepID=UPI00187EDA8D|nr:filament integrity protein FraC [Oculatella sp. LEGE 06141]MBE9180731.1 filament integrity protein fraC [Oculatella sp. LEGE 06141]
MNSAVVPLQAIAFQIVLLLTAIAVEAFTFYQRLDISRKKSVEYAVSLNLLSTVVGWLAFFNLQLVLSPNLKRQLLEVIFFDRWDSNIVLVILIAFVTFFASFLIKLQALNLLQLLLKEGKEEVSQQKSRRYKSLIRSRDDVLEPPKQANAILMANAFSYSAILLILLLRILLQTNPTEVLP